MRISPPLFHVVFSVVCASALWAADPAKIDPSKRHDAFAPAATITPKKQESEQNSSLQSKRAALPGKQENQPAAGIDGKRAAITLEETREKTVIERQVRTFEKRDQSTSPLNDKKTSLKPTDSIRATGLVSKYQDRMKAAANAAAQRQPTFERRNAFDRLNRFTFHRNVANDGNPPVTAAGVATATSASRP